MQKKVIETIKKYNLIKSGDKIVVGVSGGPDSMCLLNILYNINKSTPLKFSIIVCHINHMIREEAILDEKYVENFCKKNDIEYYIKRIDVREFANNNKIGTEEAGRIIRYNFFDEILEKTNSNKIAIAHNKNDNVETIIMHLLRGTGISGLRGIEPKIDNKIIRPLIEIERNDIEKYCERNNLNPRIDKTNFENIYTRNKIRNIVLPYIKKQFNPNIIESISRLSNVIKEEDEFLKQLTKENYKKLMLKEDNKQIMLDWKKFNTIESILQKRIIIYAISKLMGTSAGIEKVHIEDIIKLCNNNIGNKFLTPNKNIKIFVNKGRIEITKIVV